MRDLGSFRRLVWNDDYVAGVRRHLERLQGTAVAAEHTR